MKGLETNSATQHETLLSLKKEFNMYCLNHNTAVFACDTISLLVTTRHCGQITDALIDMCQEDAGTTAAQMSPS